MSRVRVMSGVPTSVRDFSDSEGTPIIIDDTTGVLYILIGSTITPVNVTSANNPTFATITVTGTSTFNGRVLEKQGADVTAANDLTLGSDGNSFEVTGNTQINRITGTGWQAGSNIRLKFTGTPVVKHGQASGSGHLQLSLLGGLDFYATAGDFMDLQLFDDNVWYQVAGSDEVRTMTPGVSFGGGTTGITYSLQTGTSRRRANQIWANGFITLTSKGSSTGAALITGLLYACRNNNDSFTTACVEMFNVSRAAGHQQQSRSDINATTISLQQISEAGTNANISDANFANDSSLMFSMAYRNS